MLRLDDFWLWDAWIVDDGERYHLFMLQAPRSLGDPERRHVNAAIGHASSRDLVEWDHHGECLGPSASGFDDRSTWTGSVVRAQGRWWMYYSAIARSSTPELAQRIGVAVSDDLHSWERVAGPVAVVDPRWYQAIDSGDGPASDAWRDPFVLPDPDGDGWHMLVTARVPGAPARDDGVLAHARSRDLVTWELGPPLTPAGAGFAEIEVAQSLVVDGCPVLVFTCHPRMQSDDRVAAHGRYSTWSVPGPGPLGPWDTRAARPFTADPHLFAAPLVQGRDGGWVILGFRNLDGADGADGLLIHDPIPVTVDADGYLVARGQGTEGGGG